MKSILKRKRAAIELSMTTIVVIVLAMTMLALGLTLVKTLFKGAIYTASSLNTQVQSELNKVFQSDTTRVGIVSEQGQLNPDRGKDQCIWWAVVADTSDTYNYDFSVSPEKCGETTYHLTKATIESWFTGLKGSASYAANDQKQNCLLLSLPKTAPSCVFKLDLKITKAGANYGSDSVYIRPKAATLFG